MGVVVQSCVQYGHIRVYTPLGHGVHVHVVCVVYVSMISTIHLHDCTSASLSLVFPSHLIMMHRNVHMYLSYSALLISIHGFLSLPPHPTHPISLSPSARTRKFAEPTISTPTRISLLSRQSRFPSRSTVSSRRPQSSRRDGRLRRLELVVQRIRVRATLTKGDWGALLLITSKRQ